MQLTVVIEVLGQPAKARKKDKDDGEKKDHGEKKEDGEKKEESAKGREVDGFWIPDEDEPLTSTPPSPGNEARPGGGWGEWRTVIPKEGECDGAVGAAVGIINALCTHPVLFHVIDGHPRLDDLIRAVTRASASQCSCAWATFSCVVNLSARAARVDDDTDAPSHELGDALLSSPAAGHLLRGLRNAVCDRWPIMSLEEMPDVRCLPPPDSPERAARRREREERRKRREKKRNKRPRRDTWKEKTPKEKAKERRREARRREKEARGGKSSEAPAEAEPLRVDAAPAGAPGSTPSDVRPEEPLREVLERLEATDESEDETDEDAEDPNVLHPNDPLANPANRLLLRTTAAAALCSLARVQRRWDEEDLRDSGGLYSYDASPADAIDVDRDDFLDPVTGRQPWSRPDIVSRKLADRIARRRRGMKTIEEARDSRWRDSVLRGGARGVVRSPRRRGGGSSTRERSPGSDD